MCKSSTLGLVASVLALLVGATLAHAWLLRPEHPVTDVASRSPRLVTIVKGATTGASGTPIEIANRATRQVTIAEPGPTNNGTTRVFGPRGLPARPRSGLWHDVSIDVGPGRMADRFIAEAADTASITCDQVWARPTAGAGTTAAAYFTLTNHGAADELVGASTPVASASVHETINDNGVMKMRPVASIALAPGKTVMFRPGGYHVMLTGLHAPLKAGESFPLTLTFAHAQPITVTVKVQTGGAGMGGGAMPGMR